MGLGIDLEVLTKFRENYIWLAAEVMTERTLSAVITMYLIQGKSLFDAKEFFELLLNDRQHLRNFMDDDLYLVSGATESELDLLFNEYLPALLRNQIDFLEGLLDLRQPTTDEISTEIFAAKKRRIGFIH